MKGFIFTEFSEMVEKKFSPEMLDQIIEDSDLPSGGAYTTLGTYDHAEAVALVSSLSKRSGIADSELLKIFGAYLFTRLVDLHPAIMLQARSSRALIKTVDSHIHVEVRKLYPDAELPKISCEQPDDKTLICNYVSTRPMADLAEGLIHGCIAHYKDCDGVVREDIVPGTMARFTLTYS